MARYFIIPILISFFFLIFPFSVSAVDFINDYTPKPLESDSGKVTIIVKTNEDYFNTGSPYYFESKQVSTGKCLAAGDTTGGSAGGKGETARVVNSREFQASWNLAGNCSTPGQYNFTLKLGSSILVNNYTFAIEQKGGQLPVFTPSKPIYSLGEQPSIIITNSRDSGVYSFWWNNSWDIAAKKTTSNTGTTVTLPLAEKGVSYNVGGDKLLCANIGDHSSSRFVDCTYKITFKFADRVLPPGQPDCSILPSSTPYTTDDVFIKGINLPPNTEYKSVLIIDSGTINYSSKNSDSTGLVVLDLGSKLGTGVYKGQILTSSGSLVCEKPLSIGTGAPGVKRCVPGDPSCTTFAGQFCDPANGGNDTSNDAGGIKTAIGCIPTNPVELIKGLTRFFIGIGGGVALLLMIFGAIQMMTSGGNPESLKGGRERFTSAALGLVFVIFSIALLQIIGVDILNLPGFNP